MCLLIETIKIKNGEPLSLEYHQKRLEASYKAVVGKGKAVVLSDIINCPEKFKSGIVKCRIIYGFNMLKIEFEPYVLRNIKTLKIIKNDNISYVHKYADRNEINELYKQKGRCDDILIVKNNFITDTSFSNVVLYDGLRWITPANPLLKGTMRQRLIDDKIIVEDDIDIIHLKYFKKIALINAMVEFKHEQNIKIFN